ncbi:bifunctional DNA primase/polymerase [Haloarcula marina]|uniref:bifunctional DNA primase/polymerase n=1 Tax=Haloarcula marina TaxID=2961574 RepID=UPI0020B90000|nr:bifunctional DNA primase/polymerase [Halomicroarcula marina]
MIPDPLRSGAARLFIAVHGPDADVGKPGKRPRGGTVHGERYHADDWRLSAWVESGGNIGRVLDDDLVAVDVDSARLAGIADTLLPSTFTVRTGSGGEHQFYRCPGFDRNTQLSSDLGSVRSDGWFVVVPPSRHPSGTRYRVLDSQRVASVETDLLESLIEAANASVEADCSSNGATADATGGSPGASRLPGDLDDLIHHDDRRAEVWEVLRDRTAGHYRRVWLAGFLLGAVDLSTSQVVAVIDRHNRWRNYNRQETARQVRAVAESAGRSR